jgi:autotransporter-associated beta strand protein
MRHSLALAALCAAFSLVSPAHSATITWTGASNQNWSNATNWDLARAPQNLDDVVLTGAGISRPLNLDLSGVTVQSLVMSGLGGLTISGNPLPLESSGTITNNDPSNTNISFQVTLNGPATFNGPLSFLQSVWGFGDLTLNGAIALQGFNFYTGSTTINGTTDVSSGTPAIPNNSAVTVTGTLTSSSVNTVLLASLSGSGTVNVNSVLTVGFDNSSTTFSGTYAGTGIFNKQGSGTFTLSGANTYTGTTHVGGGRLDVNGTIVSDVAVVSSATLGGTGTITGPVSLTTGGATLAPGNAGPGLLTVTTSLFMSAGNTLALKLNGTTPGTQYDQVGVGGSTTLGGATLSVTLNFAPTMGDVFTIITGTGTVTGTFAGLPDGSNFTVNGTAFRINYPANQVTLTVVAAPTIATVASATRTLGGTINDTVTIAGGSAPTGTVTFTAYGPNDATCAIPVFSDVQVVTGNGSYPSASFLPTAAGVYGWIARYNGDVNNAAVSGNCNDANETVIINPALILAPASLPGGSLGSPYVQSASASGGTPPYGTATVAAGSVPPGTTFSAGAAAFNFTPAAATTFSFSLQVTDAGGGSTVQGYTIVVQAPSSATASAGTPQSATVNTSFATGLQVFVTTAGSAPVQGVQVTFTPPGSGASGSFSGSNVVFTDAAGHATAPTFTANTIAGSYLVTASIPGLSSVSFSLTNTPGVAASIVTSAGTPQSKTVNTAFATALQAIVRDAFSNPVPGASVTFAAPGSGASGTFGGSPTVTTNASGVATAPAFTANTISGSYTVTATASGVGTPANFSLTNTPGVAATISATAGTPQSTTAGTAFATALQAVVRDAFANPVPGASVTFAAPGSGASGAFGGGATVATNASGVATAPAFTANATSGSYTVTATVSGVGAPASFSLTNTVGAPANITATAGTPQSTTINTAFATVLQATVRDALANPVAGVSVTFAAPGAGASGTFTGSPTVTTNASGVATAPAFTANATSGSYTVTATASGVASPASFSLTNTLGVPASISATAGTPQSATINTAFATVLQATVRDAASNPVAGISVTFAAPGSGASGTFAGSPTVTTNASGVATAPAFTANATSGSYTVTATVSGVATPASFSLTNTPGVAANITATAGTPQSTTVSTAFATVLKATVRDALANPVPGVSVTFAAPGSGASGTFAGSPTVTTNASGVATAPAFTANATSGSYTVTATASGVATPANFSLTNTAAIVTTFSGPSPTGTGTITASFTGGGAGCSFTTSQFIPVTGNPASPPGPAPTVFPHGLFDFTLGGCTAASTITMTIVYPAALVAGTQYWKYGPTPGPAAAHWYVLPATITGNTVVFTITDGGLGDDDLLGNGTIVDQGGPGIPGPPGSATAIPTLSQWAMALMALLLLAIGMHRRRR